VIRTTLGRLALRSYPKAVARSTGPEMLSMMLDAGSESRPAFVRELLSLVFHGLRERARVTAAEGRRQLFVDACAVAIFVYLGLPAWMIVSRLTAIAQYGGGLRILAVWLIALVLPALLLAGYNRIAGAIGLCAISVGVAITVFQEQPAFTGLLKPFVMMAVPAVCCVVLVTTPGTRPRRARRALWMLVPILLGFVLPPSLVGDSILGMSTELALLALVSAIGMLRLPYDPRLALGCGLVWASLAARLGYGSPLSGNDELTTTLLSVTALLLVSAAGRLAVMRRARTA